MHFRNILYLFTVSITNKSPVFAESCILIHNKQQNLMWAFFGHADLLWIRNSAACFEKKLLKPVARNVVDGHNNFASDYYVRYVWSYHGCVSD